MVSLRQTRAARSSFLLLLLLVIGSAQQLAAHSAPAATEQQAPASSYIEAFGQHSTLAVRLAALIEAEEPLTPEDVSRLAAAVQKACSSGVSSQGATTHYLDVPDLLKQYGKQPGVLDNRALEQACTAIMACQLDDTCTLQPGAAQHSTADPGSVPVTGMLRLIAAVALFFEGLAGVYIPVLLRSVQGYEWWLSLLNCFSGGVFLAAGLVHLLPHCQESQERLGHLVGDYPLYLVLITLGYMLVLFVERVLFDVHGSSHGHGPHTGIAPPCVDCITAEAVVEHITHIESTGDLPGTPSSPPPATTDIISSTVLVASAAATPRASGRYNLRSRGQQAAAAAAATGPQPDGLQKPLLAEAAGDDACTGAGHSHHNGHPHQHAHHHHAHGVHGGHEGGGHAGHVPHHHHAVVTGDLKQGVVLLVAMSVHTFLECMALGLMDMRKEFLMLFMAIASHKLISGLALSSRFLKEGATTRQITLCVGPFVFVAPAAILVGMFVRDVNPIVHLALSCFATGTFLYVGASEIVEEEFEGDMRSGRTDISQAFARWAKFTMLLLGVAAIALLSMVPDAHDHGHTHGLAGHSHGHHHHHHH